MAAKFLVKRSSVSGQAPNTSQISTGELALNLTDGIMYGSNGTVIFEIGANVTSLSVNGYSFPAQDGSSGQLLQTNGSGQLSFVDSAETPTLNSVAQTGATTTASITVGGLSMNGAYTLPVTDGNADQVLTTDGSGALTFQDVAAGALTVNNFSFIYKPSSNTTVFNGADENGNVLSYTSGDEDVYLNGVRLLVGDDYAQTNNSTITLTANAVSGDTVEILRTTAASTTGGDLAEAVGVASSNTDIITIMNIDKNSFRTAKYIIQANTSDSFAASEALLIHDGTTAYVTEYGTVYSNNELYTVSGDINGNNIRLRVTPTGSGTTFKVKRIGIKV